MYTGGWRVSSQGKSGLLFMVLQTIDVHPIKSGEHRIQGPKRACIAFMRIPAPGVLKIFRCWSRSSKRSEKGGGR